MQCSKTDLEVNDINNDIIKGKKLLLITSVYRAKNVITKIKLLPEYKSLRIIVFNDYEGIIGKYDNCIIDNNQGHVDGDTVFQEVYPYLKDNVDNFFIFEDGQSN